MDKDENADVFRSIAHLRRDFAASLPERMAALHALHRACKARWSEEGFDALHRAVHGLAGAAGTFGLTSVGDVARQLERLLSASVAEGTPRALPESEIDQHLARLDQLACLHLDSDAPSLQPPPDMPRIERSPLIFLIDDDAEQAEHLARGLRDEGYRVRIFNDIELFLAAFDAPEQEKPAALLMDMVFPEREFAGARVVKQLKAQRDDVPPVVYISVRDDMAARLEAFRTGASRYLVKPVSAKRVSDVLDGLTGRQPAEPYRVLLVDDEPVLLTVQSAVLASAGMEVRALQEPLRILEVLDAFTPDVVVLDVYMPDASGPELAAVLRERDDTLDIPILFLSSESDISKQLLALNLGGDDFLVKPVMPEHLIAAVNARARRMRHGRTIRQRLQTALYEREREHLAINEHAIVSAADATGRITYANDQFCEVSGYAREELVGQNHRIIKSGAHEPEFFRNMWRTIAGGKVWQGEICNRRKDGRFYWVESTIVPFLDAAGAVYQYVSVRTDITHIKQTAAALRDSEARLNFLVGNSPVTIYTGGVSPPYGATFVSANVAHLLGYAPEQFTRDAAFWRDRLHPEDAPRVFEELSRLTDQDELVQEYRFLHADGRYRWLHGESRLVHDAAGPPREIIGYWLDISARKEAERASEELKERLRRGQQYANIGTWDWNIVTGDLHWTERIGPLFGYPVGELETSYENFIAAVHPEDRQAMQAAVQASLERDAPYEIEHRVVWPDGTVRWLLERGAVLRDAAGSPRQMLGVVMDIDDRKRAERALHETEERFAFAVEGAGDGVWDWDIRTHAMRFSRTYMAMLGYGEFELPQVHDTWIDGVHPDDRGRVQERLRDYLAGKLASYDIEFRLRCKDGGYKWVLCRGTVAHRDGAGQALRMIGIHSEITARKHAEQELIQAREEADRANQAKSEFLSSMSHELRTPMNAILGFGQLMEFDAGLDAEHRDHVHEILKAGNHLLHLINEVLDLSKIESGRTDLSLERIEMAPILAECVSLVGALAGKRGIAIGYPDASAWAVRADRTRLRQCMLNLLSNAIKYNRAGGRVQIALHPVAERRARISVTDTGEGIPSHRMAELFQPFNRLGAEASEVEGTGIGLTITQRIVERMGGRVGAESETGVGSTFWIELPIADAEPDAGDIAARTAAAPAPVVVPDAARRQVLYVEDNPANLKLVAHILSSRPYIELKTAHSARLGLELAQTLRPDLILLDINMPDMDGYQALTAIKADASLKDLPVVAITALAMPDDIKRGLAAGFTDYLTKPLRIEEFLRVIDQRLPPAGDRG